VAAAALALRTGARDPAVLRGEVGRAELVFVLELIAGRALGHQALAVLGPRSEQGTQRVGHPQLTGVRGTDPDSDDFAVPADQMVQQRKMNIAVKARHR
jgi:hypothetical protein